MIIFKALKFGLYPDELPVNKKCKTGCRPSDVSISAYVQVEKRYCEVS